MTNPVRLIHIGKCGGMTVSTLLSLRGIKHKAIHVRKPIFDSAHKYIILIRNPIQRFISAFNWRYKLVITDKAQENKFNGEKETLNKYRTVRNLAADISNFDINKTYIHHIKENINFYLGDFLTHCKKENIVGIITTENINYDMEQIFGKGIKHNIHIHKNKPDGNCELTDAEKAKLKSYLHKDYECIHKLYAMGCLTELQFNNLSQ